MKGIRQSHTSAQSAFSKQYFEGLKFSVTSGARQTAKMPPDQNEQVPLLPPPSPPPQAVELNPAESGATSSFIPILGLLLFGIAAGWLIGFFNGSLLWLVPVIAIIAGVTMRRIVHFKKYLLHSIIRISEKERVALICPCEHSSTIFFPSM